MKDKIKEEAIEWYENEENHTGQSIGVLVDLIMDRTADALVGEVKTVLKKEFGDGTLKHNHVISPEYYLDIKLKEVKQNFFSKDKLRTEQKGRIKDEVVWKMRGTK